MASACRPYVGIGCLVVREGSLLMLRRHGAHGEGTWSTPGGHLDFGESPEACAARETLEETGVFVGAVSFVAVTNDLFPAEGRHYITLWMRGDFVSGEATVVESREVAEVGWFPLGRLPTPRFLALDNLLAKKCHPPEPSNMPTGFLD